jgi:hypothetical protein
MLAASGLIGGGLGPFIVGAMSDWLTPTLGPDGLRYGISTMAAAPLVASALVALTFLTSRRAENAA